MRWIISAALVFFTTSSALAAPHETYTVHIKDFSFKPTPVHIQTGETVKFVNDDQEAHTATATDKSFDSTGLDTGDSWTHTFTKPGRYTYFCVLHPYMKGVIIVSNSKGGKS